MNQLTNPWLKLRIRWIKAVQPVEEGRLLGTVHILGAGFHVDAIEVHDQNGYQLPVHENNESLVDAIQTIIGGRGETVEIDGRQYLLSITPFQD